MELDTISAFERNQLSRRWYSVPLRPVPSFLRLYSEDGRKFLDFRSARLVMTQRLEEKN